MKTDYKKASQIVCYMGVVLLVLIAIILFTSCSLLTHYPEDNIIEEIGEEVIESKLGWDVDLSPFSSES